MSAPDDYLPSHGDTRFLVRHYDLSLDYRITTNRLDEVAVLEVEATEDLSRIHLDLVGLQAGKVLVDRRKTRFRQRNNKLVVEVSQRQPGERFVVTVHCSGKPRPVPGVHGAAGWEELTDGVLVGSQPYGAPGWFPCNDDAADKATYRIRVDVAASYRVVANGTLVEQSTVAGQGRWTYVMDRPMSPYLVSVQIGHYAVDRRTAVVPVEVVHPARVKVGRGTSFSHQGEMVDLFSDLFGPYPFDQYRAVVVDDELEIPLEAQGLSSFGRNFAHPGWENERLVAHELAHQWFGNSVTASQLRDIWLHEGFACYAEWLWSDHRSADGGTRTVQQWAAHHHASLLAQEQDLVLTEPGMRRMFDDRVYKRGALTLHALRCHLGDEVFFDLLRSWTADHAHGVVTTDDFIAHARSHSDDDAWAVQALLERWLHRPELPALPVLNR